jgi:hypothetical protein
MPPTRLMALAAAALLSACSQTSAPEPAAGPAVAVAAATPAAPGSRCGGDIGRLRSVMENDLAMGHVNRSVYDKVGADLDRAEAACSAGRDGEAARMVAATRARHGY